MNKIPDELPVQLELPKKTTKKQPELIQVEQTTVPVVESKLEKPKEHLSRLNKKERRAHE